MWDSGMLRIFLPVISLLFVINPASADEEWGNPKKLQPEESILTLEVDWATPKRGEHERIGTTDHSRVQHLGWWWPSSGDYPHLQVLIDRLRPGYFWKEKWDPSAEMLSLYWSWFKTHPVRDFQLISCGPKAKCALFKAGLGSCAVRQSFNGALGTVYEDTKADYSAAYYCTRNEAESPLTELTNLLARLRIEK
jgi:hypothetical protein